MDGTGDLALSTGKNYVSNGTPFGIRKAFRECLFRSYRRGYNPFAGFANPWVFSQDDLIRIAFNSTQFAEMAAP